jgi:hypothetical protein
LAGGSGLLASPTRLWNYWYSTVLLPRAIPADQPHMNMDVNRATPEDYRGVQMTLRQKVEERAQRLYLIGELGLAAQLLLELTDARPVRQVEDKVEAAGG